jgi:alkylation response protein AidB-like acyl-CoA dehydrogenase
MTGAAFQEATRVDVQLEPATDEGRRFVKLAEELSVGFAGRADQHDREGSFPFANFDELRDSGILAACIPRQFGGLGMDSLHDLTVGINRLGRADGSTAISAHMHIAAGWQFTRAWRNAAAKDDPLAPVLEGFLSWIGSGRSVICVAGTEAGASTGYPMTEARRTEHGWMLNGRKIFCSSSPVADLFIVYVSMPTPDGPRVGLAFIPRGSPGLEILDNWDALGMRSSGSNDVVMSDCPVPDSLLFEIGPWGVLDDFWLTFFSAGNVGLLGAFVGIAEAARDLAVQMVTTRRKAPGNRLLAERASIQRAVAEMEINLAAARALLAQLCRTMDAHFQAHLPDEAELADLHRLMKFFVATKQFVNGKAIEVVDLALTASGGSAYLARSPVSRMYRDVRAGPFMQPYSPNEAFEYIGKVALGLDPVVDL